MRGGGERHPLVRVVAVVVDARVSHHDARQRATIGVVTEAVVVRPQGAGITQEGVLTKRQVIHHSCADEWQLLCSEDQSVRLEIGFMLMKNFCLRPAKKQKSVFISYGNGRNMSLNWTANETKLHYTKEILTTYSNCA